MPQQFFNSIVIANHRLPLLLLLLRARYRAQRCLVFTACVSAMAVLTATPSLAQPVLRLYGTVDTGMGWTQKQGAAKEKGLLSGGQSDSLWGLQGREMLGGGSYASFALEGGIDTAHGEPQDQARMFNYQSWLGLAHPTFGELRLGRQYTVGQAFVSLIEVGSWKDFGIGALMRASDNYQVSQQVSWRSPLWGAGVQLGASYSFDMGDPGAGDAASTHKLYGLALRYENGPWLLATSWEQASAVSLNASGGYRPSAGQLGASYNFGVARIAAGWSRQRNGFVGRNGGDGPEELQAAGLKGLGPAEFVNGGRVDAIYAGASIPTGHGEFQLQWSQARPDWEWQGSGTRAKTSQVVSLGYLHPVSLRTSLYVFAAYGRAYGLDAPIDAAQPNVRRLAFGVNTRF